MAPRTEKERATRYQRNARSQYQRTFAERRAESVAQEMRTTVAPVLLVIGLVFLVAFFGCNGWLNDSEYETAHAQAQQELKESGAWVMW